MKRALLSSLLIALTLASCQQVVDADKLLDVQERVSILGYLSPSDTVLRVDVSKALPAIGTPIRIDQGQGAPEEFLITDALVTIGNANGDAAQLIYDADLNAYLAPATELTIEVGGTYFLTVVVNGEEYNASCTIPKMVEDVNATIDLRPDGFGQQEVNLTLAFTDFEGENNFYIVGATYQATFEFEGEPPFISQGRFFFDDNEFLTDNINDGGTLNAESDVFLGNLDNIVEASVTLQVAHTDEFLYRHLRSSRTNEDAGGNPFVEYAIAPTNILNNGAIGIFAGYALTESTFEVELE
ncbi:DUF4249 family protein [Maribacter sp. 2307ULW6-5]|uniref:DUF4249 family protein n=1 Tax=Maribacter sp. 2307ULW6-5 TaxID=3386275 RepID=UPI0039BC34DA